MSDTPLSRTELLGEASPDPGPQMTCFRHNDVILSEAKNLNPSPIWE